MNWTIRNTASSSRSALSLTSSAILGKSINSSVFISLFGKKAIGPHLWPYSCVLQKSKSDICIRVLPLLEQNKTGLILFKPCHFRHKPFCKVFILLSQHPFHNIVNWDGKFAKIVDFVHSKYIVMKLTHCSNKFRI